MIFTVSILLLVAAVNSQAPDYSYRPHYDESPKPYAFNFDIVLDDGIGRIARTETGDGSGRVQGAYALANDEGHSRVVHYVADQDGFRAQVRTDEPGTDNQNPADVDIESASPFSKRNYHHGHAGGPYRRPVPGAAPEPVAPEVVAPVRRP